MKLVVDSLGRKRRMRRIRCQWLCCEDLSGRLGDSRVAQEDDAAVGRPC